MPVTHRVFDPRGQLGEVAQPDTMSDNEFITHLAKAGYRMAPPESGEPAVSRLLAGARGGTQEAINSFLRTLAEPRLPAPTEQPLPGGPFESGAANIGAGLLNPVPGSAPEAAAMATAIGAPFMAGRGLMGGLTRAAIPGAAMTGAGLAEGEDPLDAVLRGAMTSAVVGGFEAGSSSIRALRQFFTNVYGRDGLMKMNKQTALDLIKAIQTDLPAVSHLLNPDEPASLSRLVARAPGKGEGETVAHQAIRGMYDQSDRAAQAHFGNTNLAPHLPALVRFAVEQKGIKIPKGQQPDLRIVEAQQLLKEAKAQARLAMAGRQPAAKFDPIALSRRAEEQYRAVLTPDLRDTHDSAVSEFSRGLSLIDAVEEWNKQGLVGGTEKGTVALAPEMAVWLRANMSKLGDREYPAIYRAVFAPGMAQDVELSLTGGVPTPQRVGTRLPGGGFVTAKVPVEMTRRLPGGMTEAPVPTDLSRGLMNALAITATRPVREELLPPVQVGRIPRGR